MISGRFTFLKTVQVWLLEGCIHHIPVLYL